MRRECYRICSSHRGVEREAGKPLSICYINSRKVTLDDFVDCDEYHSPRGITTEVATVVGHSSKMS